MEKIIGKTEIWKDIIGYEGLYQISNLGRIKSLKRKVQRGSNLLPINEKILSYSSWKGYPQVNLWKENLYKTYKVHRLIAIAFIPNPENKPEINHKDGNHGNHSINNLEWVTSTENQRHSWDVLGRKHWCSGRFGKDSPKSKQILKVDNSGQTVDTIVGLNEAAQTVGGTKGGLFSAMKKNLRYKGFLFTYKSKN